MDDTKYIKNLKISKNICLASSTFCTYSLAKLTALFYIYPEIEYPIFFATLFTGASALNGFWIYNYWNCQHEIEKVSNEKKR